jgi:hypothetical protein
MVVTISDPQKHQDATQGTFITYLVTTNASTLMQLFSIS